MAENIWQLANRNLNEFNENTSWMCRINRKTRKHFSYKFVCQNVLLMAKQLAKQGAVKGGLVGIIAPNGRGWGMSALAIWKLGAIVTPVSHWQ